MNRKARLAWELYLKMETSSESFSLLQLIANDCYKVSFRLVVLFAIIANRVICLTNVYLHFFSLAYI